MDYTLNLNDKLIRCVKGSMKPSTHAFPKNVGNSSSPGLEFFKELITFLTSAQDTSVMTILLFMLST